MRFILLLLLSVLFFGCITKPYINEAELPKKNIKFYTRNEQFRVKPDWFWRLRPETSLVTEKDSVIGHKYLKNSYSGYARVIGEITKDDEEFYIANWSDAGYFFIKKKDYEFSQKYKKYFIDIDYNNNVLNYYNGTFLTSYFEKILKIPFIVTSAYQFCGPYHKDYLIPAVKQRHYDYYTNEFVQIEYCPLLEDAYIKDEISSYFQFFVLSYPKEYKYTNPYGQLFIGTLYKPLFIIFKWGEVFYALPFETFKNLKVNHIMD